MGHLPSSSYSTVFTSVARLAPHLDTTTSRSRADWNTGRPWPGSPGVMSRSQGRSWGSRNQFNGPKFIRIRHQSDGQE